MERETAKASDGDGAGRGSRAARTERIRIEQHGSAGLLWFGAWLFTIGYLHLPFWRAVLALVIWPYYLGAALSPVS